MDTIFALSTAPGTSGIAVIRISGPHAGDTLKAFGLAVLPPARVATLVALTYRDRTLDRALVLYFSAPHSFTGEDVVEYHVHGGRAVIQAVLHALSALPFLRPADAGEFTRRAYLHGKIDLTAAEGLADLLDAQTEVQRRQAVRFMEGEGAAFYRGLRANLLVCLALMEAYIDFPEEDIPAEVLAEVKRNVRALGNAIEGQLADNGAAERIRDGIQVAIIGPPNAGKSSLLNLLAARDVAIVSHEPGTTRDVIEVHMDIAGYAVLLADTAGIREAGGDVEREGIRRSLARADAADIRVVVMDAHHLHVDEALKKRIDADTIVLLNKADLGLPSPLPVISGVTPIAISVRRNTGLDAFIEALSRRACALCPPESSFIIRSRHRRHLTQALLHLRRYEALDAARLELACEELRSAGVEMGRITGSIAADEVLGEIFSRFCIGK